MKLTPEQRYTAYCIMLYYAEKEGLRKYKAMGFQHLIARTFPDSLPIKCFSELYARRDDWVYLGSGGIYWQQRCALLREIIAEMEKKLYT